MDKVLVTGGLGFIGSQLVEALVERNFQVSILDDFSLGFEKNIEKIKKEVEVIKGDVRNFSEVEKSVKDCKYVFHMSALSYVGESLKKPELYNEVNVEGTLNVLNASKLHNVERFVFPSTCVVYGNVPCPIKEDSLVLPNSPYAITKAAGEYYCKFFTDVHGLDTICMRIFNAYGPRMNKRAISFFAEKLFANESPKVTGNGEQVRDFVFSSDIVDALIRAVNVPKKYVGNSYNVASGKGYSLNEVIALMNKVLGKNIAIEYVPEAKAEVFESIADTSLSKKHLGFEAKTSIEEGLKITLDSLKENLL